MRQQADQLTCEKLLTIVDSISDGVFTVDLDFKITFVNRAAKQIIGIKNADLLGRDCKNVFRTNFCEKQCIIRQTIDSGKPIINCAVCMTDHKGKRLPISVSCSILKNESGQVIGGVETFRDLSLVEHLRKELESSYTFEDMIGHSRQMQQLFKLIPIIAESKSTILVEGESGTGKELVARAIHSLSPRKNNPMVCINCGALPDSLLESELFGYKAGAFTGAKKDKKGRFALANTGTLFLDEIGDISPALQVKLLRVIQENVYEPLGATKSERTNVRIVAASNRDLAKLVEESAFRKDLYYRINVIRVKISPLRERKEDIPLLVSHFVGKFNQLHDKNIAGFGQIALNILLKHDYPGNVRELENIVEHAFVLSPGGVIKPEHLPDYLLEKHIIPVVEVANSMSKMESLFIIAALKRNDWIRKKTAKELGIDPSTLYRKIKKLGLKLPRQDGRVRSSR